MLLYELSTPLLNLKVTERSRVIADLPTMARLVPLERPGLRVRSFGVDQWDIYFRPNDHDGYADAAGDGTSQATREPDCSSAAHDSIVFRRRSQSAYGP